MAEYSFFWGGSVSGLILVISAGVTWWLY